MPSLRFEPRSYDTSVSVTNHYTGWAAVQVVAWLIEFKSAIHVQPMKPHEVQEKLGLTRIRDRVWYVQPSCATTGDGLYEGLTWLTANNKS
ncbi:ADP-ribosylation factor 6 [Trichonephila clavipes]|nr:ADP-ribosylation factor 6 [Trichonephila clavipes]